MAYLTPRAQADEAQQECSILTPPAHQNMEYTSLLCRQMSDEKL